jgi:superfamily II DNA or RNA helicase
MAPPENERPGAVITPPPGRDFIRTPSTDFGTPASVAGQLISSTVLRPYQREVIDQINAAAERRIMLVAPTGTGKTVIAAAIIHAAVHEHVLFFVHRREIVRQTRDHLAAFGVTAGIILAGEPVDLMRRVQVASIQTLHARCIRGEQDLPPANIVFVDEAHHATAETYRAIIECHPDAKIIGMTATPCRRDGCGLGSIFECMIECPQVPELIKLGFLVPTKVFAPSQPDLRGVHTRHGDYAEGELADRMDRPELVGDIVSHWHRLAERKKTVVFATSVSHSIHLKEEFCKSGVKAEHIDGSTPKDERDAILQRLSDGDLELVSNCQVLTEGWDQPDVACCVLARPTKSMGLYRQMAGRVIRPYPGKDHALILDHAGAVFRHGFVEDEVEWVLSDYFPARVRAHEKRKLSASDRLVECSQCKAVRTAGRPCDHCGFMPKRPGEYLEVIDGDLAHVHPLGINLQQYSAAEKQCWHAMLVWIGQERSYKPGWAAHKYKERFGHWPVQRYVAPMQPSAEVLAWERHCRIKYAKSMARQVANA